MSTFSIGARQLVTLAALFLFSLFGLSACGGGTQNHEVVYLHVFNGYAGAESLSLYGPSGPVVTDLGFGERTDEPVAFDRNHGGQFLLIIDGAPQTFPIFEDLYALYPQETATIFVSRRHDVTAHAQVFRHIQSISPACRLVVYNGLSLTSDSIAEYAFILGWDLSGSVALSGYDQSREQTELDAADQRPELYNELNPFPYFALVEAQDTDDEPTAGDELTFVWIGPEDRTDANIDYATGTIISPMPTQEYIDCLEEQEDAEGDPDAEEIDCSVSRQYTTLTYEPASPAVEEVINYYPEALGNAIDDCSASLRIFSDFDNIFTGSHGHDDAYDGSSRIDINPQFRWSDHFFAVLYGRPVDPFVATWLASDPATGGGFVDMDPYPNGQ